MQTRFVVQGVTNEGAEVYYTGKAGQEFVTSARGESFGYTTAAQAENRVRNLNRMSEVHGIRFVCASYAADADWFLPTE
jgi:hypothetical protein